MVLSTKIQIIRGAENVGFRPSGAWERSPAPLNQLSSQGARGPLPPLQRTTPSVRHDRSHAGDVDSGWWAPRHRGVIGCGRRMHRVGGAPERGCVGAAEGHLGDDRWLRPFPPCLGLQTLPSPRYHSGCDTKPAIGSICPQCRAERPGRPLTCA